MFRKILFYVYERTKSHQHFPFSLSGWNNSSSVFICIQWLQLEPVFVEEIVFIVVAICDRVHDVETMHGLC